MGYNIAFFGSSLVSAYWNGAATYYRGIIKAIADKGHKVTFYEPDAFQRQQNRDIPDPDWAESVVYPADENKLWKIFENLSGYDVIIKASGVGIFDDLLEQTVLDIKKENQLVIFWDVDAPATLDSVINNPENVFKKLIPKYDLILTYGGGEPVISAYKSLGAKNCIPVYNALDPSTHFPVACNENFKCNLSFLGNRLPDREKRVESFFLNVAEKLSDKKFILGGNGWHDKPMSSNVKYIGHVYTKDHNAFNCSPDAVLNISRESMAKYGFSPATRVFEAAGAASCIITDYWIGIDSFFEPDKEILIVKDANEVVEQLKNLTPSRAKKIGTAAYKRVLAEHTYAHRVRLFEDLLNEEFNVLRTV